MLRKLEIEKVDGCYRIEGTFHIETRDRWRFLHTARRLERNNLNIELRVNWRNQINSLGIELG